MDLVINGKKEDVKESISVIDLIKHQGVESPEMVSIELNGEILKRDEFDTILLKENDKVEFLYFMGGGGS